MIAATMRQSARKFCGTLVMLAFVGVYVIFVVGIGGGRIAAAGPWTQFFYFAIAGLLWVLPAGLLIRWMQRPDTAPARKITPRSRP